MEFGTDNRLAKILLVGAVTLASALTSVGMYYVSKSDPEREKTSRVPAHSNAGQLGITYDGRVGIGTGLPGLVDDIEGGEVGIGVTSNQ